MDEAIIVQTFTTKKRGTKYGDTVVVLLHLWGLCSHGSAPGENGLPHDGGVTMATLEWVCYCGDSLVVLP